MKLLAAISTRFVNLPVDRINDEIEKALRDICTTFAVDQATIYQVAETPARVALTHLIQIPEIPSPPTTVNAAERFPWCLTKLSQHEMIYLPDTLDAPTEASVDVTNWRESNIRSLLVLPLSVGNGPPIGFWSLGHKEPGHRWSEDLLDRLRITADIFANALQRKRTQQKLLDDEAHLNLASLSARVAFWTIDVTKGELWSTGQSRAIFKLDPNEDLSWEKFLSIVHPEDLSILHTTIENVLKTGEGDCEYRAFWPDGTVRWIMAHGSRAANQNGVLTGVAFDVTERKLAEIALRRREGELQQAQRLAHVGSWTANPRTGLISWSDEMYRIHGLDPALPPPMFNELEKYFTPESWNRLIEDREVCLRTGVSNPGDLELVRPGGERRWVSARAETERAADGTVLQIRGTLQDITERKNTEQRLREYEQTIEDADEMIAVIDRDFRYLIANRSFLSIRGMTKGEVIGRYMWEVLSQQVFDESVGPHVKRAFQGEVVRFEFKFSYPKLGTRDIAVSYFPLEGQGRIERVLCILHDVTEVHKREQALRESEERFRRVVEHISDALIVDDVEGRIQFANEQFLKLFRISRGEVHRLQIEDYVAPEFRGEIRDRHNRRVKGESVPTHFEYQGIRADRTRMWLEADVVPIKDAMGKVIGTQTALRDITVRRQMELDLRRRTSELAEAQRIARVGSWTWDPATDEIQWSDEMIALAGWDPKKPIPTFKEHTQFFSPESYLILSTAVQNTLRTGTPYEVEAEGFYPNGTKAWFINRGEVVRDTFGQITHLRGTTQDITERKNAECALRESEERYRSIVESSHDWIWQVDAEAKYTYVGPQCLEILGYLPEEILGKTPFDLMPEWEASRVAELFRSIAEDRKSFRNLENTNVHKDGSYVVIETNGVPVFDERGTFIGYRGTDRDVTERKKAEKALRDSERKFADLFRTAPVAIALRRMDGKFVDVNDAFVSATGFTREEAIGRTAEELQLFLDSVPEESKYSIISVAGLVKDIEQTFRKKDGDKRTALVSSDLIEIGGEAHVLTALKDITEQKLAENNLRDLGRRLINAQEDERKRIARELHDNINQRLALLSMGIQQIEKSTRENDLRVGVRKLLDQTKSISSDVQSLSHHLHSASLDLLGLAAGIESFRRDFAKTHQVTIDFVHHGVPKTIPGESSLALFRITQEALSNAVKYSRAKHFEIELIGTAEHVELTIRDAGVGFDVEAVSTKGLGLISMRERILPLNGTISIKSKPLQGTEIRVTIPLQTKEQWSSQDKSLHHIPE